MIMKKPPQELIDAFFQWFEQDPHTNKEDYYRDTITLDRLSNLSEADFIEFFYTFAREGGQVQSGGHRTSGSFRKTITEQYPRFRTFVLKPFHSDFDEAEWLRGIQGFKSFGKGLATIYLNRVDKRRFPILNNKAVDSLKLFGVTLPADIVKGYQTVRDAHWQLITWYPKFENFFRTDALAQFLIGEKVGLKWQKEIETMQIEQNRIPIWKVSHGRGDFNAEQRETYLKQHTVHVHKDTRRGQGKHFTDDMKEGDLFYLCHGNDDGVRLFGRITSAATTSSHARGFRQRSYKVIFPSVDTTKKYTSTKKGWAPNYNSTCMRVPDEELGLFESNILVPFFNKQLSEIPGYQPPKGPHNPPKPPEISLPSKNVILYGPPGTGKTYTLRNEYMKRFTEEVAALSQEDFAVELVTDLAWWQVITIVMMDLKEAKVSRILEHPLMQARIRRANHRTPRAAIWGHLQMHTKTGCDNVRYTRRYEPLLFWKDDKSVWSIDEELAAEEVPELVEMLERYKGYTTAQGAVVERFAFTTFHQSFSYEDFVEGIKPVMSEDVADALAYEVKPGIFKTMVQKAMSDPYHDYALLIDEISRGNVASIFGELIALIEDDKRQGAPNELRAQLPYSREEFVVPANLYIIGAMNTADRSVEALDTALRRRFTFIQTPPNPGLIQQPTGLDVNLQALLTTMNARIEKIMDKDHCIGHSYFMGIAQQANPLEKLRKVFAQKILPLLEEYFYGDPAKIGMVLGKRFVKRDDVSITLLEGDWEIEDFADRRVYSIIDPMTLQEEDFRTIYE